MEEGSREQGKSTQDMFAEMYLKEVSQQQANNTRKQV